MRRSLALAALAGLTFVGPGCAQGGGAMDAGGGGGVDAFTPMVDTGTPPAPDASGPDPVDAGSVDAGARDAGPTPVDAGPTPADAGRDAGGPTDAGPPDSGPDAFVCDESPCRLAPPLCGCPGGQSCYPSASGRTCATPGATREGGACTMSTECGADMVCADDGRCRRTCATDTDCTARGALCTGTASEGGESVGTCSVGCEPKATGGTCPSGDACRYFRRGSGGPYYTDCRPEGSVAPGDPCTSNADCTRDHVCVNILGDRACQQSCTTASDCPFPLGCREFLDSDPTIGSDEYGFCFI